MGNIYPSLSKAGVISIPTSCIIDGLLKGKPWAKLILILIYLLLL